MCVECSREKCECHKPQNKRRGRFSREVWAEARTLYVKSELSFEDVAEQTKVSHSSLIKRACPKRENWSRLRAEHRLRDVSKGKFDAFTAQVASGEAQPATRARWAKRSKHLAQICYDRLVQMHAENTLTPHKFAIMINAWKKIQDAEFAALGIASNIAAMEHTEGLTWSGFLRSVRAERGLDEDTSPFNEGKTREVPRLAVVKRNDERSA